MAQQKCTKCSQVYELTKDNFGHTPSGYFRKVCRGCMRKSVAKHSKENPDLVANRAQKRKAAEAKAASSRNYDTEPLRRALHREQHGSCYYCKEKISVVRSELEHKIPIIKGGTDTKKNIVVSCYQCNKEKHNKTIEEYRSWRVKNGYKIIKGKKTKPVTVGKIREKRGETIACANPPTTQRSHGGVEGKDTARLFFGI